MLRDLDLFYIIIKIIKCLCFVVIFISLAYFQYHKQARPLMMSIKLRWARHFSLLFIGLGSIQLFCSSVLPLKIAIEISKQRIGILQGSSLSYLPYEVQFLLGLVLLDLGLYWQHRLFHHMPLAWRFHKAHHSDREFELSTGLRFHPIECLMNFILKVMAIVVIGPPVLSVLVFELLLNFSILFSHTNIELPEKVERIMRCFMVTPLMHRIHHSCLPAEHHSNFGFLLSIWDRLFLSYKNYSKFSGERMNVGLVAYRDPTCQTLKQILLAPFERSRTKTRILPKTHMSAPLYSLKSQDMLK